MALPVCETCDLVSTIPTGDIRKLIYRLDVGPIADEEHFVVRWKAQGTYHGGMPGVPAESVGRKVDFSGTDILRIVGGKMAEYWGNTDSLLFAQQLGMVPLPSESPKQGESS